MAPVAFAKTRRDFRSKLLTVAKGHDHLADVDRRISDFDLSVAGVKAEKTKTAPKELAHSFLA